MMLLAYSVAVIGLAFIIGHSKITLPLREALAPKNGLVSILDHLRRFLVSLIECAPCLSFHIGWICYLAGLRLILVGPWYVDIVVAALYTCGSSLVLGKISGIVE